MKDYSQKYNKFCDQFDAKVTDSEIRFAVRQQIDPYTYTTSMSTLYPEYTVTDVKAIAFHVPEPRVKDMMQVFNEESLENVEIRRRYPAVQKAWDQYLNVLALCGGGVNAGYRY
jgi:hypothetical protein